MNRSCGRFYAITPCVESNFLLFGLEPPQDQGVFSFFSLKAPTPLPAAIPRMGFLCGSEGEGLSGTCYRYFDSEMVGPSCGISLLYLGSTQTFRGRDSTSHSLSYRLE